jgi:hypothetical protein
MAESEEDREKGLFYARDFLKAANTEPVIIPARGETAAVPWMNLMTVTALAYDRVWMPPFEPAVPDEVRLWGGTAIEHTMALMALGAINGGNEGLVKHTIRTAFGIAEIDEGVGV